MVAQIESIEKCGADIALEKKRLRLLISNTRSALSEDQARKLGLLAQKALLVSALWAESEIIALYASREGEVSTQLLLDEAWREGKTVLLPKITNMQNGEMQFGLCRNREELVPGYQGILEPALADAGIAPDTIVAPGTAFDLAGNRLGYGKGFYDRYLGSHTGSRTVGLCYSFQVVGRVPTNSYDRPVEAICTNGGFVWL